MNAIVGFTHILRRESLKPDQDEKLKKIAAAADHLLGVINDVLDISKIEADKLVLEQSEFDLEAMLARICSMVDERMREKKLELVIDADASIGVVSGDATRLGQALLNYLGNAIKFTEQGSIVLRARVVEETGSDALIHFEVEDSGIGIAAEHLPRLFNAFEQADNSTTRKYGGTGLGLAITRRLAKLMGGEAGVASTPGVGSTFWLTARLSRASSGKERDRIPQLQGKRALMVDDAIVTVDLAQGEGRALVPDVRLQPAEVEEVLRREFPDTRLLLVEDEPINREVTLFMLDGLGWQLDSAENGQKAVAMVMANDYQLILMDMQMPVMNGLDATRAIRQLPRGQGVAIMAMTANAFAEDKQQCLAVGMNDFISKPVVPTDLYALLLKWCLAQAKSDPGMFGARTMNGVTKPI